MTTDHYISREEIISIGKEVAREAIKELFDPSNPSAVMTATGCKLRHAKLQITFLRGCVALLVSGAVGGAIGGTLSFSFANKQAVRNGEAIQNVTEHQIVNEAAAARDRAVTKEDRAEHKTN